jgi:hypothetical protein
MRRSSCLAHALILPNRTTRTQAGIRTGYSLLVDQYVDANLAEPAICDALICDALICDVLI